MKRPIGMFLLAGLLSGSAMFAAASPSSALPRNGCMDAANYMTKVQSLSDHATYTSDSFAAWQNAVHFVDRFSGGEAWTADLPDRTDTVYFLNDYYSRLGSAQMNAIISDRQLATFIETTDICP